MIVVMRADSTEEDVGEVLRAVSAIGASGEVVSEGSRRVIQVFGTNGGLDPTCLGRIGGVDRVLDEPATLLVHGDDGAESTREVAISPSATIGGTGLGVVAGPCSVERGGLLETARAVADAGASAIRGALFKPRTSPYTFQGLHAEGLDLLAEVRIKTGLPVVTEVMSAEQIELVRPVADILQIGSRNMHNTPLLTAVGSQDKPVVLKRGWSATLQEFLSAAEYIAQAGNPNVILCERGIRAHEDYVRNTLALAVVPEVHRVSTLPIVVDPSHGTGHAHLVEPMAMAAVACGADGLMIEVHPEPARAWSDAGQALDLAQFASLMKRLRALAETCGRTL